jgi:peptidyl-prolyl cis-trans isomerase D
MLDNIREGAKKPWAKYFIFAIVISFVFAGGFSVTSLMGDPNAAAIVNGESVTRNEFQREYASVKASQADFYKANVKTEEDEKNFQENVLQQLITETVTKQSINDLGLRLSNDSLRKVIQSESNYQVDGKYSAALAEQTMARAGMTREAFKKYYQSRETRNQINAGLFQTDFVLDNEAKSSYELMSQKRTGRAIKINTEDFKKDIEISEEEIKQYYADNQEAFRLEEKVSVEYIELSAEKLKAIQQPTDEQIALYYQDNIVRFQSEEQRQYSHILVLSNDDEAAALAKANSISERIKQGEDFAEIAKIESDDAPTKENGGDLGVLLAGSLDEASEKAANDLVAIGDVTAPVKLDFGFQILKLTNLTKGNVQPLAEVKDELLPELKKQLADEDFYAKAESLKEKTFEFSDSLAEAAEATGLEIKSSPLFGRSSKDGIFSNEEVKNAAFSSDVVDGKLNSESIEIAENHIVVLRLKEHKASEIQTLDLVREKVVKNLTQTKAKQAAENVAKMLLAKIESKEDVDELLKSNNLAWIDLDKVERNNSQLSYMANTKFFKMPEPVDSEATVELSDDFQGYSVLLLNNIEKGNWADAEAASKEQRKLYLASYFSNAIYESYQQNLRKNAEVKRNLENLAQ